MLTTFCNFKNNFKLDIVGKPGHDPWTCPNCDNRIETRVYYNGIVKDLDITVTHKTAIKQFSTVESLELQETKRREGQHSPGDADPNS